MKKLFTLCAMALAGVLATGMSACNNGEAGNEVLRVEPALLAFDFDAGHKSVTVTGNDWTASVDQTWVTIDPAAGSNGTITVNVEANMTAESRYATLEIANAAGRKTVTIEQGFPGALVVNTDAIDFSDAGESKAIAVSSDTDWNAVSNNPEWLTIAKGVGEFTATALPNEGALRGATITVDNGIDTKIIEVTQDEARAHFIEVRATRYAYTTDGSARFDLKMYSYVTSQTPWTGWYLSVNFIAPKPSAGDRYSSIAEGTYTVTEASMGANPIWTIPYDFFNSMQYYNNGALVPTRRLKPGSTITVEGDYANYKMTMNIVLDDGEEVKARYDGPIVLPNPDYTGPISTLTEDFDFGTVDPASGDYQLVEDRSSLEGSYVWLLWMHSQAVSLPPVGMDYVGSGVLFNAQFASAPLGGGEYLPDGTYNIVESGAFAPGSVLAGFGDLAGGAWLRVLEDDVTVQKAPLASGTVTTSHSGNTYTMTLDCMDDAGNAVDGTLTGELRLYSINSVSGAKVFRSTK